jgi:hypothetical protein
MTQESTHTMSKPPIVPQKQGNPLEEPQDATEWQGLQSGLVSDTVSGQGLWGGHVLPTAVHAGGSSARGSTGQSLGQVEACSLIRAWWANSSRLPHIHVSAHAVTHHTHAVYLLVHPCAHRRDLCLLRWEVCTSTHGAMYLEGLCMSALPHMSTDIHAHTLVFRTMHAGCVHTPESLTQPW